METLLVNCYDDESIDWPSIEDFGKKYKVTFCDLRDFRLFSMSPFQIERLSIIVDGDATIDKYIDVLKRGNWMSALGVCVHLHWIFNFRNPDDLQRTLKVCQQNNVGLQALRFNSTIF